MGEKNSIINLVLTSGNSWLMSIVNIENSIDFLMKVLALSANAFALYVAISNHRNNAKMLEVQNRIKAMQDNASKSVKNEDETK